MQTFEPDANPSPSTPRFSSATLVVNSGARVGAESFEFALECLRKRGIAITRAERTKDVRRVIRIARDAVAAQEPLVIVGGGDGTLNAVAGNFLNSSSTLGVLPLGTGNALARDLAIPVDVAGAVDVALCGQQVEIDLGRVGGGYFVNVATVGLTSALVKNLAEPLKRRFGRLVYIAALVRAFADVRPFRAVIETENGTDEIETIQIVIGNGRFHAGPFPIMPDADIRNGVLSVYAIEARTKAELVKFALFLPGGRHVQLSYVHSQHCCKGKLSTSPSVQVTTDGQLGMYTPIDFGILPRALRVMAGNGMTPVTQPT